MAALGLLGFGSGLPLALTADTIQAWLRSIGFDLATVGFITLVGLPYSLQVAWAPFVDRFAPRLGQLGRRRAWLLATQLALAVTIVLMAVSAPDDPGGSILPLSVFAVAVAFVSSTQDIAANAYRTDVLPDAERGAGAAVFVTGYRLAMIATGAGVLALSGVIGWRWAYVASAIMLVAGVLGTLIAPEPPQAHTGPATLDEAIVRPLRSFLGRRTGLLILLFVLLFKLPDYLASKMTLPFLLDLGYSTAVIATIRQTFGLAVTILGALVGGGIVARMGLMRSLILFGLLQALSNAGFLVLANAEPTRTLLTAVITVESFCGGLVTAGFVAFLMSCCQRRYSATQYALLVSMMTLGSTLAGSLTGLLAERVGYSAFFGWTIAAAVPGLALLPWVRGGVEE